MQGYKIINAANLVSMTADSLLYCPSCESNLIVSKKQSSEFAHPRVAGLESLASASQRQAELRTAHGGGRHEHLETACGQVC